MRREDETKQKQGRSQLYIYVHGTNARLKQYLRDMQKQVPVRVALVLVDQDGSAGRKA